MMMLVNIFVLNCITCNKTTTNYIFIIESKCNQNMKNLNLYQWSLHKSFPSYSELNINFNKSIHVSSFF